MGVNRGPRGGFVQPVGVMIVLIGNEDVVNSEPQPAANVVLASNRLGEPVGHVEGVRSVLLRVEIQETRRLGAGTTKRVHFRSDRLPDSDGRPKQQKQARHVCSQQSELNARRGPPLPSTRRTTDRRKRNSRDGGAPGQAPTDEARVEEYRAGTNDGN